MSDTPETNEEEFALRGTHAETLPDTTRCASSAFARKLERQRNKAVGLLKAVVDAEDNNSGSEPSRSVLLRAMDEATAFLQEIGK